MAGRAGPRPRLADVAAEVGVSTASVSLVLRNAPGPSAETRAKVLEAVERLGYRPDRAASLLARHRSHLLGVLLDIRSSYHAELVEDLHAVTDDIGYDLVLSTVTSGRSERRAIETLVDSRCEALILLGPDMPTRSLSALAAQLPVVAVGRRTRAEGVAVVRSADDQGVAQAVDHLVELGHERIAYVDGGAGTIASDRRRGYRRAMRRHGLQMQERVLAGDHDERAGIEAARVLLADGELPTAVVAYNDQVAVGLLDALTRAGVRAPEEMSVVGYDDSPLAQLVHVDLTTVSQEARQQAECAVAAAVQRLDGNGPPRRDVVLPPRLVIRGTTAPPRF